MQADLRIKTPDDWHVHLRDDDMLEAVVAYTAQRFARALVMPNLVPPVSTGEGARDYRTRILALSGRGPFNTEFNPVMALYLTTDLVPDDLIRGHGEGLILGVKYYPAGATTNSDQGGTSLLSFRETLEIMAEHGIPLLIHAEAVDESLDIFDREAAFLEREVQPVCDAIPELSITVEHLSTAAGVALVKEYPNTSGSITPHHLSCDRSDLLANGMRPHLYCKPVINSRSNRDALREAAVSGDPRFFMGTDSAPHPLATKEADVVRAGIFSAPYALEVVAEVFFQEDALDHLEAFVSLNGASRYGFPLNQGSIRLTRLADDEVRNEVVSTIATPVGDQVRLFGVREAELWSIVAEG